ncbi:MAG: transcriptional activator NhaR [Aureliella sp.]
MSEHIELNYQHLQYFWAVAHEGSVAAAAAKLHLTQPTVSMQLKQLQRKLGCQLFEREGRGLVLTDAGRQVLRYADEIFALGRELTHSLSGNEPGQSLRLVVGVPDAMPKLITRRLLQPALQIHESVTLECYEAKFDRLLADLATDRFDVVLSDCPLGIGARVRAYNHPLGDCGIAFCGTTELADRYRRKFPQSLNGAPMLLPTLNTDLRRSIDQWLDAQGIEPRIVAEFDDSALLKEFGYSGLGLFPVPSAVLEDVKRQYQVKLVGKVEAVRARYFAITSYRRVKHPAVVAICAAAPALLKL